MCVFNFSVVYMYIKIKALLVAICYAEWAKAKKWSGSRMRTTSLIFWFISAFRQFNEWLVIELQFPLLQCMTHWFKNKFKFVQLCANQITVMNGPKLCSSWSGTDLIWKAVKITISQENNRTTCYHFSESPLAVRGKCLHLRNVPIFSLYFCFPQFSEKLSLVTCKIRHAPTCHYRSMY